MIRYVLFSTYVYNSSRLIVVFFKFLWHFSSTWSDSVVKAFFCRAQSEYTLQGLAVDESILVLVFNWVISFVFLTNMTFFSFLSTLCHQHGCVIFLSLLQSAVTCLLWPAEHAIVYGLVEGKVCLGYFICLF